MKRRSVVIHGHFYQPPREDPWTGRIPLQPSAAPAHDWNERIHDECYRAVVAARLWDDEGRVEAVMNTLEWMSWDAGPTLLHWMARERPETYARFIDADHRSRRRTGHGNALATPYHHVILPLTSRREKVTEVRWGIADFRRRFGREPEGMWLPEAAVDTETLEVLAREGIRFTVLGPGQVVKAPQHGLAGRVEVGGGRSVAVFVYDGALSNDVAFGAVIHDAHVWVGRMAGGSERRSLVALATDGETFGHHHRWGEMGLAAALRMAGTRADLRLENFGAFLARNLASEAVEIVEPSAWSCAHGVDRWMKDCGCKIDPARPTSQAWRTVLRDALVELATGIHERFAEEGARYFVDPWAARDEYGALLEAPPVEKVAFLERHAGRPLAGDEADRAIDLLEMERDVLRMDTSCAWFFDDVARLEPLQNLLYAAHALDLMGEGAGPLERRLLRRLEGAVSNDPTEMNAARLWETRVRGGQPEADPPPAPSRHPLAAVERVLRTPSGEGVRQTLSILEGLEDRQLFDAQTATALAVAERGGAGLHLGPLVERLRVSPFAGGTGLPAPEPLRFVFGLHLHQPVGNFDHVFESHVEEVYLPFLERCADRGFGPLTLHVSGPLLEWMDRRGHAFLDAVARMVGEGTLELLLAGFYEPVLTVLSREDRLEQIGWMHEYLEGRFGADAVGLWLTERVWEPGLASDLVDAGVEYVLLDDRHFQVAGFERHRLHRPWRTESEGRSLSVLPIDERLRYLIPFRSPGEIGGYLRNLASIGHPAAVLADDGEKFGGWPGTAEWVWRRGWLDAFLDEMERLAEDGVATLATASEVVARVPAAGLAYLPSASYREMEEWSLPPQAAEVLSGLGQELEGRPGAAEVLRGGHWRNFIARYDESNRMHKKAQLLSEMCRAAGDPPEARRAIGRAQCNDAYWHGVFGGLYLRHLRNAIWSNLAEAESHLRDGQGLSWEVVDADRDGHDDVWVHSSTHSVVVRPSAGGCVSELVDFEARVNVVDVLTRRRESYHRTSTGGGRGGHGSDDGGMPSIHDLEEGLVLEVLPPVDRDVRALFVDRLLPADLSERRYAAVDYEPLHSWSDEVFTFGVTQDQGLVRVEMLAGGVRPLSKEVTVSEDGTVTVSYEWDPSDWPAEGWFAPELSMGVDVTVTCHPAPEAVWRFDVETVSKSESGFEETVQGESITPLWPCRSGKARLVVRPPSRPNVG